MTLTQTRLKSRSPQEVWAHHGQALAAKDVDEFIKDFADDCLFINNPEGGHANGVYRGPEGVRRWCEQFFTLFESITDFKTTPPPIIDNVALVRWEIEGAKTTVRGGVDTFVFKDGQFQIITVLYDVRSL